MSSHITIFLDTILERNGVGSYYKDLIDNINEKVDHIELIGPQKKAFTHKLKPTFPGDKTQRLHFPKIIPIYKHIKDNKPDIIILPMVAPFAWLGFFLAKKFKIPFYFVLHNNSEELLSKNLKGITGYILKRIYITIDNFMIKHSPNIIALNKSQTKNIIAPRKPIHIIGTTLSDMFLTSTKSKKNTSELSVLYCGRLSPEKNLNLIIDAAQKIPELTFNIAGDGPLKPYIINAEKTLTNLNYLGWIKRKEIIEIIDQADILLLPSNFETFGTAALEGMSRGKLVVVSENTGILEWQSLKENLFILKNNESITSVLKHIHSLPKKIQMQKSLKAAESAKQHNQTAINSWLQLLTNKSLTI